MEAIVKHFELSSGPLIDVPFSAKFQKLYFIGLKRENVSDIQVMFFPLDKPIACENILLYKV